MEDKIKVLFLIHDLGQGGAEKVLVNLVNNMNPRKFDITVTALFGGGVNEQFLKPHIRYRYIWKKAYPGNSKMMIFLSPRQLHGLCVKGNYDIEVSYLEGPSARIISGCTNRNTKTYCWIHSNHFSMKEIVNSFRSVKEAMECYTRFYQIICVSKFMKDNFCQWMPVREKCQVLSNTVESDVILEKAKEDAREIIDDGCVRLVAAGTLKEVKGFDRLLRIVNQLVKEGEQVHLYLLGKGPLEKEFQDYVREHGLKKHVTMLGYQTNPYKYVAKCDLYVCSSRSEGFSTAVTEALIVGTAVCTVDVSGMREMLGENNEYGIVTANEDQALYHGIQSLLQNRELLEDYKKRAEERGKVFQKSATVQAVEKDFLCAIGRG